jgi:hypothetical protein
MEIIAGTRDHLAFYLGKCPSARRLFTLPRLRGLAPPLDPWILSYVFLVDSSFNACILKLFAHCFHFASVPVFLQKLYNLTISCTQSKIWLLHNSITQTLAVGS